MTTNNKATRRYRKRGHDDSDDDNQHYSIDIENDYRKENNDLKRETNLNLAHHQFSHQQSSTKYETDERPKKIARRFGFFSIFFETWNRIPKIQF
jgi:hypothetical protein